MNQRITSIHKSTVHLSNHLNFMNMPYRASATSTFKQMIEFYSGGAKFLRELRASAQSQMLNVNKSSAVIATVNYQMSMSILLWQYQQTLEQIENTDTSKMALKTLQWLNQLLSRNNETSFIFNGAGIGIKNSLDVSIVSAYE
ncbi:hypothetical protein [Vibrio hepatarius]|uniref:hypothetical protein n=1 Tax=Vibrio hepatarius TaxID=171383 RepID=UPI001C084F1D|nr:hypothetical protein [Vibrio hepatarius]MBU2895888.1 hypothetical protein [Vibrio hepatarius]